VSAVSVAHLMSVCAYAGFQWTVHLVVYPQLAAVPSASFVAYERAHQRRISYLVGPLFAALVVTTALLWARRPEGISLWMPALSAALLLVILAVTGLLAVPLHRRLERGWDRGAHQSLVRVDAVRLAAATANVVVSAFVVLG